ncbi:MAG TPA: hypothetical protein VGR92_19040 [Steroidobacteraceae bacterium]|nr:hypothetical protein [Steroidobacteraceae bacterium]
MKSVAKRFPAPFIHLLLVALLPGGAFAAQAHSSMEVSVQVVRDSYSTAAAALFAAAAIRASGRPAIDSDAECKAIGNVVVMDGALATCSWDSATRAYLVTVQY